MRLSSRFILDIGFMLTAAFIATASMTWSAEVAGWTAVLTSRRPRKLGHGIVGLADLTWHEATTEKVVHQLVVHDTTQAEQRTAA